MKTSEKNQNTIIQDIARSEKDIYRIQAWQNAKGSLFVDLRVYFRKNGELKRTEEGLSVPAGFRYEIAGALMAAKNAPELEEPAKDEKFRSVLVTTLSISETEQFQISKVRGHKNSAVRICHFFKGKQGEFLPNRGRSISIWDSSVQAVAEALQSPEPAPSVQEAAVCS